ncbi:unnamed protein product [Schistosoma haematobium]|nr:unnamed protein product [Schistosoma haematobium]
MVLAPLTKGRSPSLEWEVYSSKHPETRDNKKHNSKRIYTVQNRPWGRVTKQHTKILNGPIAFKIFPSGKYDMKVTRTPLARKQRNSNFLNKITKLGPFATNSTGFEFQSEHQPLGCRYIQLITLKQEETRIKLDSTTNYYPSLLVMLVN